jgi:predicted DNA-binding WGR domain protein
MRREIHLVEGSPNKFWAIELKELAFTVHFGRFGTAGQAQERSFASAEQAHKECS